MVTDGPLGLWVFCQSFANLLPIFCWVHGVISRAFFDVRSIESVYCSSTFSTARMVLHLSTGQLFIFFARNREGAGRSIKLV